MNSPRLFWFGMSLSCFFIAVIRQGKKNFGGKSTTIMAGGMAADKQAWPWSRNRERANREGIGFLKLQSLPPEVHLLQ